MVKKRVLFLSIFPILGFCVVSAPILYFGILFGPGIYQTWGHQTFEANGLAQIEPAVQVDEIYDRCMHHISYGRTADTVYWQTKTCFGGRYHLSMQVQIEIESNTKGYVTGEPEYYLWEVSEVTPNGGGASYSDTFEFGPAEWKKVYEANGDFSVIGYKIKTGPPVEHFNDYVKRRLLQH